MYFLTRNTLGGPKCLFLGMRKISGAPMSFSLRNTKESLGLQVSFLCEKISVVTSVLFKESEKSRGLHVCFFFVWESREAQLYFF